MKNWTAWPIHPEWRRISGASSSSKSVVRCSRRRGSKQWAWRRSPPPRKCRNPLCTSISEAKRACTLWWWTVRCARLPTRSSTRSPTHKRTPVKSWNARRWHCSPMLRRMLKDSACSPAIRRKPIRPARSIRFWETSPCAWKTFSPKRSNASICRPRACHTTRRCSSAWPYIPASIGRTSANSVKSRLPRTSWIWPGMAWAAWKPSRNCVSKATKPQKRRKSRKGAKSRKSRNASARPQKRHNHKTIRKAQPSRTLNRIPNKTQPEAKARKPNSSR
jgi:Bacterial regulatory proteins, tetR family